MAKMEYWCFFNSYERKTKNLSDKELGQVVRALTNFNITGEMEELEGRAGLAFDFIVEDIKTAQEKYAEKCDKAKRAIKNRYSESGDSSTNVYERIRTNTKQKTKNKNIYTPSFATFWEAYPKKVGKGAAAQAFASVDVPVEILLEAIDRQKTQESWKQDDGRYIPNPSTWLNQRRWEDEPMVQEKPKAVKHYIG